MSVVALDWEFLFAWTTLLAVVVAPVRLAVLATPLPDAVAWPALVGTAAATFLVADWLDREGFDRLAVVAGGPATFVVVQFLLVPTVALVVAPPSAGAPPGVLAALERPAADAAPQAWAAFAPAVRPRVVRPAWLLAHLLTFPFSVWLGLYGGLARLGADPRRTAAFAPLLAALLGLGLLAVPLFGLTLRPADRGLWAALLACELLAAAVAYRPALPALDTDW